MKIYILVDNNTLIDRYFLGEPGVSYYIEDENTKILFDTGYSDIFIKNAMKMQLDLYDVDYIVISHGHLDHTWGLVPLMRLQTEAVIEGIAYKQPKFISHPDALKNKRIGDEEIGCIISEETIEQHYKMNLTKKPFWLTDRIVFLGEIERKNDFEGKVPIGTYKDNGIEKEDYVLDDSALVYQSSKGLVIITGCSHAGICNIVDYAKKVCGDDRILDIVGGFHLLNPNQRSLDQTVDYFSRLNISKVHACHCTDFNSKLELSKVVELKEVGVGMTLNYD